MLSACLHPYVTVYCVHLKVSSFMALEQRGVSLGAEAAACSRGPVPGSPYPIQLGFVIGSPGLKDTVHHLTRLNACKMSNQHCVWSLWPPRQASFLQATVARPRRPHRWSQEQISVSPHIRSLYRDLFMLGETRTGMGAHHTSNTLNIPSEWKRCWLRYHTRYRIGPLWKVIAVDFLVSQHSGEKHKPTGSEKIWPDHFFIKTQKHHVSLIY